MKWKLPQSKEITKSQGQVGSNALNTHVLEITVSGYVFLIQGSFCTLYVRTEYWPGLTKRMGG